MFISFSNFLVTFFRIIIENHQRRLSSFVYSYAILIWTDWKTKVGVLNPLSLLLWFAKEKEWISLLLAQLEVDR